MSEIVRVAGYQLGFIDDPIAQDMSLSIFFAGCPRKCKGCHNPELQDPNAGEEIKTEDVIKYISRARIAAPIKNVIYLGGEPLLYIDAVEEISQFVFGKGMKNILYTGYTMEEIEERGWLAKLGLIHVIVDGPYMEWLKRDGFPASKNQRVWVNQGSGWFADQTAIYIRRN